MASERVLVVDDEKLIRWSVKSRLEEEGLEVLEAASAAEARRALAENDVDMVLLDHRLPDATGLEILQALSSTRPEISTVMMTAYGTVDTAVQAMKLGAHDFLTKPVNLDELALVVARALEASRLRREVHRLRREQQGSDGGIRLIGTSPGMRAVAELVDKVCRSQASTILLQGESGTGKDVVAKAIHYRSSRAARSFVNITCSALTETLLESELFGHERGAFTDAHTQKKGLLEVADGGTAFLDEIGETGGVMQAKLLRFLEEKTFKRVGGTRDIKVDVRVIAATNRRLDEAVQSGRFRADLFYRLNVIPITLPPLRERREDIPALVQHFIEHFNRELKRDTTEVAPQAMAVLQAHDWPGNIRELRNVIERVMILENERRIEVRDLPPGLGPAGSPARASAADAETAPPVGSMTLDEIEQRAIRRALESTGANQVRAARLLGISRDTLRYRMRKYGLG